MVALIWPSRTPSELSSPTKAPASESRTASLSLDLPQPRRVTPILGNGNLGSTPEEVAERYVDLHREVWGLKEYHRLHPTVFRTPLGTRINYAVYQGQVPILGMEVRIQIDRFLKVAKVENEYRPLARIDIPENLPKVEELVDRHLDEVFELDRRAGVSDAPVLVPVRGSDEPVLAFVIPAKEKTNRRRPVQLLLRADDGQILRRSVSRAEF